MIETDTSGSQGLGMGLKDWLQADLWQIRLTARAPFHPVGVGISVAPALQPGHFTTILLGRASNTGIPGCESHVFRRCPTFVNRLCYPHLSVDFHRLLMEYVSFG